MKIFFIMISVFGMLWANPFGNRLTVPILGIDKKVFYTPAMDLKVGESGFVIHELGEGHTLTVARTVVIDIKDDKAYMSFERYNSLDYDPFPRPTLTPQVGDSVVLRLYYDRAFLIAPNQEAYIQFSNQYKDVEWLHPDLFAAYLISEGKSAPTLKDFQYICEAYSVGIVYLVRKGYAQARDCQTFALIKQDDPYKFEDEEILPFFSRLGNLKRSWTGALTGDKKIQDFNVYYEELIQRSLKQFKNN